MAHNGNLTNAQKLKKKLIESGAIFQSTSDTEVILHLLSTTKGNIVDRIIYSLKSISGAYALLLMTEDTLIGIGILMA